MNPTSTNVTNRISMTTTYCSVYTKVFRSQSVVRATPLCCPIKSPYLNYRFLWLPAKMKQRFLRKLSAHCGMKLPTTTALATTAFIRLSAATCYNKRHYFLIVEKGRVVYRGTCTYVYTARGKGKFAFASRRSPCVYQSYLILSAYTCR